MMNFKRNLITSLLICVSVFVFAQGAATNSAAQDTTKKKSRFGQSENSTQKPDSLITDMGVAVSPSSLRFRAKPGSTETRYVTITNDTKKSEKFKISFADYDMSNKGAVTQVPFGKNHEYGLTKWISATPSFVELRPGQAQKIAITINVPDEPNAYRSAWCLMMVDETTEKKYITPPNDGKSNMVMGVIPVFGFGVYIFQNPPNVKINKVEITKFYFNYDKENKYVYVNTRNVGDGIGFCKAYVEVNNLNTGYKEKLFLKQFTIFPGMERTLDYQLPGNIGKGNYIATAVLDFGSDEEVEAAELEFKIE
ncbi:MAG: hypothetical protein J0M08_10945 [Bacteroidetes bacterium]|nr:hypothetical protein [Bacteroidota bacterium]